MNDQKAELAELYRTATADAPRVWHLHGHISRADSLILAPGQYEAFYGDTPQTKRDYEAALLQLRSLVANYSLLFAGFSFSDPYVMDLLVGVLDAFGGNLRSSYALVKAGEQTDDELWKRYQIRPIEFADFRPAAGRASPRDRSPSGRRADRRRGGRQRRRTGASRCPSSRPRTPSGSKRSAAISTCWACASSRARRSR